MSCTFMIAAAAAPLLANEAPAPDGTAFTHAVLSVDGPDLVRIRFCGVPIQVRLANVKTKGGDSEAQGLKYLRDTLKPGTQVRIELEPELIGDGVVPPPMHVFAGATHINIEMLKRGMALSDGRSKNYVAKIQNAQADAMTGKLGLWASGTAGPALTAEKPAAKPAKPAEDVAPADYNGPVVADLNGKEYHLPGSRFATSIRAGAKIEYKSPEEAERAGKVPSPFSFPDRAKASAERAVAVQASKSGTGSSAPQSTAEVVEGSRKALADALTFMNEARRVSHNDTKGANDNWKKAARLLNDSLDRLTPVADANPNDAGIQKLAEDMTMNLYSCNKYQSL